MNRRCTGESCQLAASRIVNLDLPVATILHNPAADWKRTAFGGNRIARDVQVDWKEFTPDKYLFTHVSIVCSVETEDNGFYIKPACSDLVNSNGNAWTNEVLLATFQTFRGAYNYLEHVQIPSLSKGTILDAVVRPVKFKDAHGRTADIFYVDILVGTDRIHTDLVKNIESGKLTTMSMGCSIAGTPVFMHNGVTKNVEDIVVGDKVITHTGGIAEVESTRVRQTAPGELRHLKVDGVPDTFVTGEHPYWTLIGYDVCRGCGKPMSRDTSKPWGIRQIIHPWCSTACRQQRVNSNPKSKRNATFVTHDQKIKFDWVPVSQLRKGDYVAIPLGRPVMERPSLERYKARLLGYYAAEGNLQRTSKGIVRAVEFSLHKDEPAGDEIMALAREWGVAEERIYSQIRIRKSGSSRRIVIHDREMAAWMLENCGIHCDGKKFAPWVMELDDKSVLEVLGSYVNGDGHCRKRDARFATASCSRALSEQVLMMMLFVGIPANINRTQSRNRKPAWCVYTRHGMAGAMEGYTYKFISQPSGKFKVSSMAGHMLRCVTSNEPMSVVCNVHNIHVKNDANDHSYIMNGIAVHNCLADYVTCSKCGKVFGDNEQSCKHIESELGSRFVDPQGVERVVSELCGRSILVNGKRVGDKNSVKFIEASWVEHPAFQGAVLNHYVSSVPKDVAEIVSFSTKNLEETIESMFKLRVADRYGMVALKLARKEFMRRKHEAMIDRLANIQMI